MIKFTTLIIAFFVFSTLTAQTVLYGKITDANNKPLVYANIYLKNNRTGTYSDINGNYKLQINIRNNSLDTLIISYLGYKTKEIPVILNGKQKNNIVLEKQTENIKTITITAKRPKYTALQIIKKAGRKIKKNYINKTVVQKGFYRETLKENGITLKINECVFNYKSVPYPSPKYSRQSFNEFWDDYYFNKRTERIYSQFAKQWPVFITLNDKVNIIKARVSIDKPSINENTKIGDPLGGPIDVISLNNVKYKLDIFNPKLTKKYVYKIKNIQEIDNELYYIISFTPKDSIEKYFWNLSKKFKKALFKGTVTIRKSDFAVLSVSCETADWHKSIINNEKDKFYKYLYPFKFSYKIDFQPTKTGLILKHIKYKSFNNSKKQSSVYQWEREINLSLPSDTIKFKENSLNYFPVRSISLREVVNSYDSVFWNRFEKSKLFIPLSNQELYDLERTTTLKNQFLLLNQSIAEIPVPEYSGINNIKTAIKQENNYSNAILHKLNNYTRSFQAVGILYHNYEITENENKKKTKYFLDKDSLMNYYYYENINDSIKKKIFNISYENKINKGGFIDELSIRNKYIFYKLKFIDKLTKTIKIKEKSSIKTIDSIPDINEFAIANDSMIVYSVFVNNRPCKLFMHKAGENPKNDSLLLFVKNNEYDIEIKETTSKKFIIIDVTSKNQNEIWVINKSNLNFRLIYKSRNKQQITTDHFLDNKYFTTLLASKNYTIIKTDIINLESDTILKSNKIIDDFYLYQNTLLYTEYNKFDMRLVLFDIENNSKKYLNLPKAYNFIEFAKDENPNDSIAFFVESVINPPAKFKIDLKSGNYKLIDKQKFAYSTQKSEYKSEVIDIKNSDGKKIPVLLFYDELAIKDSVTAILFETYGAYGVINVSTFDERNIELLKKGFIIAKVSVRGEGTLGQNWYFDGKLLNKENTFSDFITVVKALKQKYNLPAKRTFAKGVSAGGLVMGVMANRYSNEFGGIILDRPFLDVYNSMKDSTKYLTTIEYQEWGNPSDSIYDKYIKSYSPYQNITKQYYTNLFFRASEYDFITPVKDILKTVAKYRENNNSNNLILLKTRKNEGHIIRYNYKDFAEEYAFMMYVIKN